MNERTYTVERAVGQKDTYDVYLRTANRDQAWAVYKRLFIQYPARKRLRLDDNRVLARYIPTRYKEG